MGRIKNYEIESKTFSELNGKIKLPKFQRSLVWNKEAKKDLIRTIMKGDPFGVILLYEGENSLGHEYLVIDGLQRFTTLVEFSQNPMQYYDNSFDDKNLKSIVDKILFYYESSDRNKVEKDFNKLLKEKINNYLIDKSISQHNTIKEILEVLKIQYPDLIRFSEDDIIEDLSFYLENIRKKLDISNLQIPILRYTGEEQYLPDVFEKLNNRGTKLTKYEVYAASWSHIELKLLTKGKSYELLKKIDQKYSKIMEDSSLIIKGYQEGNITETGKINLYELVYGLGKLILENNNIKPLTNYKNSSNSDDSIGFTTINTFLGRHLKDLHNLPEILNSNISPININKLITIIIKSYEEVAEIIKPYADRHFKFIESQTVAMVYTWFRLNYEIDLETLEITEKVGMTKLKKLYEQNMPYRVLFDIFRNRWSGSGDNTLYEIVRQDIESNRYLYPVKPAEWEQLINEIIEEESISRSMNKKVEHRMMISYGMKEFKKNQKTKRYKDRYLIPKKYVPKGLPAGHIGNIMLYDSTLKINANEFFHEKYPSITISFDDLSPGKIENKDVRNLSEEEYLDIVEKRALEILQFVTR